MRKYIVTGLTALALGVAFAVTGLTQAQAAVPAPVAGNITVLSVAPRIVPSPGSVFAPGETKTFDVAGKTFSGVTIPANATGITISISATNSAGPGKLTAWTTDAGQPGPGTVTYTVGGGQTNVAFVGLNDHGQFNVYSSAKTQALIAIQGYVTPVAAPVVKTIGAQASKTIDVGGSIRSRATDFGSVTLPAGTWDARVLGGWTGLNNVNNTVASGVSLTGTMVLVKGDTIAADFSNDVTAGGVVIPRSSSNTLTQDPTASISTILVLDAPTEVHVKMFAYASDSSQAGSGELEANLQGAQFVKLS